VADLATGTIVDGRYKVVGRLGSGGMADVFLAEDQQLGRKLALKLLHRRFAEDEGFVERFRREAQAAAGLQHPNVVGVYDRGAYDGTYYIAMEYVPGRTLKRLIAEEAPLDPVRAIDITTEILKAVRFAHRRGVIHRDLKPHNVIVDDSDHAKVTDFGIARAGASDMTETGSILGTAQYLSPEQAQGHAVSPSSDLYSVGVILYELLTGRVPFDAEAAVTIAIKHVSEAPVAPRTLNPAIPPELEQVVLWSLNKNAADRPSDAQELIEALGYAKASILSGTPTERTAAMAAIPAVVRAAGASDVSSAQPYSSTAAETSVAPPVAPLGGDGRATTQPPAPPTRRRRRDVWLWVVLVALLLAAAGAAAYYLLSSPTQVAVPSVVGRQLTVAKPVLQRAGFKINITYHRSTRASGIVLNESPAGGTQADQGSTVTLTVSRGPGTVTVPQVQGATLTHAEDLIRKAGLKVGKVQSVNDSQYPAGEVSSTSPIAGVPVPPGTPVKLFVSAGPLKRTVPNVTGQTESAARSTLTSAGFGVQVVTTTSKQSPGTVVSQNPPAGTQATPGSTVTIDVAKAQPPPPTTTKVPNVTGDTAAAARSVLTAAGFTVTETMQTVSTKSQDGTVLSQSPSGGSSAKKGSTVTIVVGHYKKPSTHTTSTSPTTPGAPLLSQP
jgi:eukaryotic-like serine/threonine-protein kinase